MDFGKLHFIKEWIDQKLDHALLICKSDPYVEHFKASASILWKLHLVDDASCEGLCDYNLLGGNITYMSMTGERQHVVFTC